MIDIAAKLHAFFFKLFCLNQFSIGQQVDQHARKIKPTAKSWTKTGLTDFVMLIPGMICLGVALLITHLKVTDTVPDILLFLMSWALGLYLSAVRLIILVRDSLYEALRIAIQGK